MLHRWCCECGVPCVTLVSGLYLRCEPCGRLHQGRRKPTKYRTHRATAKVRNALARIIKRDREGERGSFSLEVYMTDGLICGNFVSHGRRGPMTVKLPDKGIWNVYRTWNPSNEETE